MSCCPYVYDVTAKTDRYQTLTLADLFPVRQKLHEMRLAYPNIFNNILFNDILNKRGYDYKIWTHIIIQFLNVDEFISLSNTCTYFDSLLNSERENVIAQFWKLNCTSMLNISFLRKNHFKPINNNWKQFYIELKTILMGLKLIGMKCAVVAML